MLTLPFALVGGAGDDEGVGCNALAGVSAELGVVMLTYLDQALECRRREGRLESPGDLAAAIVEGASRRVRQIFMTVGGLLPIMWATGTGSQVMKRSRLPWSAGWRRPPPLWTFRRQALPVYSTGKASRRTVESCRRRSQRRPGTERGDDDD